MRLGTNYIPAHSSPTEWAEILSKKGYEAVCFPVNYEAPVNLIDAYVKAAKDYDLRIAEVGVWNSPHGKDGKRALQVCEEQFRLADYIKADCCVNISGSPGINWNGCDVLNFSQELYEKNVEMIQGLCDRVKPKYSFYTLEPMQWMLPDSPEQYLQFIKDVDREGFAVHMDVVNWVKDPYTYTHMDEMVQKSFELLGPYIKSCHLKDCKLFGTATVEIHEVPLGEGIINLPFFYEQVRRLHPDMPVLLEHLPDMEAYDKALAVAKSKV